MRFLFLLLLSSVCFGRTNYQVYRMPSSGNVPGWGTIFKQSLPALGQGISSSSSSFSTSANTPTAVTNLSVTLTTTGRPVVMFLQPDGSQQGTITAGTNPAQAFFYRASSPISNYQIPTGAGPQPGGFTFMDTPTAGTYNWTFRVQAGSSGLVQVFNCTMVAYEID